LHLGGAPELNRLFGPGTKLVPPQIEQRDGQVGERVDIPWG